MTNSEVEMNRLMVKATMRTIYDLATGESFSVSVQTVKDAQRYVREYEEDPGRCESSKAFCKKIMTLYEGWLKAPSERGVEGGLFE